MPAGLLDSERWPLFLRQLGQQWKFRQRLKRLKVPATEQEPAGAFLTATASGGPCRILVCGWYGTETLGDKAILAGIVSILQEQLTDPSLHIASLEPYITRLTTSQMPELEGACVVDIAQALELTASMDLVLFGGGPVMATRNLAEMLAIFERAAEHGIPTMLAGCGVGPLGSKYQNRMIRRLLKLASVRIYRDERSRATASGLGVETGHDLVAEDPAFTWISKRHEVHSRTPDDGNGNQPVILLGLRDWPCNQYARNTGYAGARTIRGNFEQAVVTGLEALLDTGCQPRIVPFPMCTNHYGGDDRWFYRRLFRQCARLRELLDYSVLSRELAPDEAIGIFNEADAALTMRFHSLVFATALGIPAVACDYTMGNGKVAALAESAGIPCRPIDAIDADFVTSGLLAALQHRDGGCGPRPVRLPEAINTALEGLM
jgi:polysaccharide pyruvyl transferase WcaK-like protein